MFENPQNLQDVKMLAHPRSDRSYTHVRVNQAFYKHWCVLARDQNTTDSGQSWRSTKARCAFVPAKSPNVDVPAIHD